MAIMKSLIAAIAVVAVLSVALVASAHAQPGIAPLAPPPRSTTEHYGWKIGIVDLLSLAAAGAGLFMVMIAEIEASDSDEGGPADISSGTLVLAVGTAGYLLGGPIIHGAHRNHGGVVKSLGLRVGLPLLGVLAGRLDADGDSSGARGAVAGLVAMIVDDTVVARRQIQVAPYAAPMRDGGVALGVSGRF